VRRVINSFKVNFIKFLEGYFKMYLKKLFVLLIFSIFYLPVIFSSNTIQYNKIYDLDNGIERVYVKYLPKILIEETIDLKKVYRNVTIYADNYEIHISDTSKVFINPDIKKIIGKHFISCLLIEGERSIDDIISINPLVFRIYTPEVSEGFLRNFIKDYKRYNYNICEAKEKSFERNKIELKSKYINSCFVEYDNDLLTAYCSVNKEFIKNTKIQTFDLILYKLLIKLNLL
jgi:hypothetical protein